MARHRFLLISAVTFGLLAKWSVAQDVPTPTATPTPTPSERPWKSKEGRDPRFREMREHFQKMTEEQRDKTFDQFRKWQQMPGDEQAHFRFIQGEREKRAQKAVDDTIASSGLTLDAAQKQKFTEIYKRERRKLEEELRVELDKMRQQRMPDLQKTIIEAYQKEAAEPTPSPSPSATP